MRTASIRSWPRSGAIAAAGAFLAAGCSNPSHGIAATQAVATTVASPTTTLGSPTTTTTTTTTKPDLTFAAVVAEVQASLRAGKVADADAIPDAVLTCPDPISLVAGQVFACTMTTSLAQPAPVVVTITATGGTAYTAEVSDCRNPTLTSAQISAIAKLGPGWGCPNSGSSQATSPTTAGSGGGAGGATTATTPPVTTPAFPTSLVGTWVDGPLTLSIAADGTGTAHWSAFSVTCLAYQPCTNGTEFPAGSGTMKLNTTAFPTTAPGQVPPQGTVTSSTDVHVWPTTTLTFELIHGEGIAIYLGDIINDKWDEFCAPSDYARFVSSCDSPATFPLAYSVTTTLPSLLSIR